MQGRHERILAHPRPGFKPGTVTGVWPHFDKVNLRLAVPLPSEQMELLRGHSDSITLRRDGRPFRHAGQCWSRWKLTVVCPDHVALNRIARLPPDLVAVNYVEAAIDIAMPDEVDKWELLEHMRHSLVQPRTRQRVRHFDSGFYTGGRRNWFAVYADLPSKVTGEVDIVHCERRLQGTPVLRQHGIVGLESLLTFDHRGCWQRVFATHLLNWSAEQLGRWADNKRTHRRRRHIRVDRTRTRFEFNRDRAYGGLLAREAWRGCTCGADRPTAHCVMKAFGRRILTKDASLYSLLLMQANEHCFSNSLSNNAKNHDRESIFQAL